MRILSARSQEKSPKLYVAQVGKAIPASRFQRATLVSIGDEGCGSAASYFFLAMTLNISIAMIFALATILPGTSLNCEDPVGICGQLSKELERALVNDEGNLFRIRRAFFHSPTASPVLLKVIYDISYAENFITLEEISPCFSQHSNHNQSTIGLNQTSIILGWTSSGVYTMFHPAVLSVLQVQSPFAFLRIMHRTLTDQRSPEADTFLWDGSYDLPTVHLNLHVTSLTCLPSQEVFMSVLKDLNTMVCMAMQHNILLVPLRLACIEPKHFTRNQSLPISPPALTGKISCINEYYMATFTALQLCISPTNS
jgi:hypothetical protein